MIDNIAKVDCTGCGACLAICPTRCIQMLPDSEGFFYPQISFDKCITCHLCDKVCPVNLKNSFFQVSDPRYMATSILDDIILKKSSSGGVFSILAKNMLAKGGYVCGCVFNEQMQAEHICSNNWDEVQRMQGAKYVQSNSFLCFREVRDLLKEGFPVLFSGTPCQVDGIRSFLSKEDTSKLLTIDVICHGVPSRLLLKSYKDFLEKKHKGKLTKLEFRNKEKNGWGAEHHTYIEINVNGKIKKIFPTFASYFTIFFWGIAMRPSCYSCIYTKPKRVSDITLGDFWGADKTFGDYLERGISIVGINTQQGSDFFDEMSSEMAFIRPQNLEMVAKGNIHLTKPVALNPVREFIYVELVSNSYSSTAKHVIFSKACRPKLIVSVYRRFTPTFIKRLVTAVRHHSKKKTNKEEPPCE